MDDSQPQTEVPANADLGTARLRAADRAATGPLGSAGDAHLVRWLSDLPGVLDMRDTLAGVERLLLQRALREAGGVQAEAARNLGISRSDMTYKLRKHHLRHRPSELSAPR